MDSDQRKYMLFGLRIAGDFGATIAIPVVALALLGRYLEDKYHFAPWGLVCGLILAALITGKIIYTKAKKYGKEYVNMDKEDSKE